MSLSVFPQVVAATARISVPTVFEAFLGRIDVEVCDRRLAWWAEKLVRDARIALSVEGKELVPQAESFVVMSNHQSHYDIPVLFHAYGRRVRMVTKKELFKVPIWGSAMRAAGFVEVDRGNRHQAVAALGGAASAIAAGTSIWIAPEGTRSRTGELAEFKKGGFHLAETSGARILPVSIQGTRKVLPADGLQVSRGESVRVRFGAPIDPAEFGGERKALMRAVRDVIARGLA